MPKLAVESGVDGQASISCAVTDLGLLKDCTVVEETPENYGFGQAALALAPFFQMQPATKEGKPVAGGVVTIPIVWKGQQGNKASSYGRSLLASPPWAVAPSWEQMRMAWPTKAGAVPDGFVTLRCRLSEEGVPMGCVGLSEAPEKLGFETAAKALSKNFRLGFSAAEQPTLKMLMVDIPFHFRNPAQGDPRRLGAPRWVRTMSPAAMATLYPTAARAAGVFTGRGVVRCTTTAEGELASCSTTRAEPVGLGFEAAAQEAAKIMRLNPWTADGEPVEGLSLTLPIRFTWDDAASSAKPN